MLEELLGPREEVRWRCSINNLQVGGQNFDELIVTDKRLIFYKQTGLVFKKDVIETMGLKTIDGLRFREKGTFMKKGVLEIPGDIKMFIEGNPSEIKQLYQALNAKLLE